MNKGLILLLFTINNIAFAKTFYYFTERPHMIQTYEHFATIVSKQEAIDVVRLPTKYKELQKVIDEMSRGDIFFADLESQLMLPELTKRSGDSFFDSLSEKEVKIHLLKHKTSSNMTPSIIEESKSSLIRNHIRLISSSHDEMKMINTLAPQIEVVRLDYLELCNLTQLEPLKTSDLKQLGLLSQKKKILFAQQYNKEGGTALLEMLNVLKSTPEIAEQTQLIIALHPSDSHFTPKQMQRLKESYPTISFTWFKSGAKYKTLDLFPHIDGVASLSSTVGDLAAQINIPNYNPQHNEDYSEILYTNFRKFLNNIDPSKSHFESKVERLIQSWIKNIRDYSNLPRSSSCPQFFFRILGLKHR